MRLEEFDYELPKELIAQRPLRERDTSRMLVLDRAEQSFADCTFRSLPEILVPGDVLVFHSDGIGETSNSEGQFFGTEKLRALVEQHHARSASELADLIFQEVDWFAQGAPLADDRTLVVMKVR